MSQYALALAMSVGASHSLAELVAAVWASVEDGGTLISAPHLEGTESHLFVATLWALFPDGSLICSCSITAVVA